jgi:hypothetical protein
MGVFSVSGAATGEVFAQWFNEGRECAKFPSSLFLFTFLTCFSSQALHGNGGVAEGLALLEAAGELAAAGLLPPPGAEAVRVELVQVGTP